MSWKKIGKGILKGMKVANEFAPVLGKFGPPGVIAATGIAFGVRIAAKLEGPQVGPYKQLVHYLAQLRTTGWPTPYGELKRQGIAQYMKLLREANVPAPDEPNLDFAVTSAIMHVKEQVALDAIKGD